MHIRYFERAFIYLKRNFEKTTILLVIIATIGILVSGAISVQQAIYQSEINLWSSMPAIATIDDNFEAILAYQEENNGRAPEMTLNPETVIQISELPHVRSFDFSFTFGFYSNDLEFIGDVPYGGRFQVKGVYVPEILDLEEKVISLVTGRSFTQDEIDQAAGVVLISQALAQRNGLTVGSTFVLESRVYDHRQVGQDEIRGIGWKTIETQYADLKFEMKVIGIFEVLGETNTDFEQLDELKMEDLLNQMYIPGGLAETARTFYFDHSDQLFEGNIQEPLEFAVRFALHHPLDMTGFIHAANEQLPDVWAVVDLSDNFGPILTSMENMSWMADTLLLSTVMVAAIVLSLLTLLFLHDRRYEIGVYLALGEKKSRIASQILIEIFIPAVVSFSFTIFTGNVLASKMSSFMLENQLIQSTINAERFAFTSRHLTWFNPGQMSIEEMMAHYDVSLNIATIFTFFTIGFLLMAFTALVAVLYMTRLNPKKILIRSRD